MKGVILAAGKGSRLYPATRVIPKPLMPLANRMTMEYAFDQLKGAGITDIALVVGENQGAMHEALDDGDDFGVNLTYVRQPEPKGLAHAVGYCKDFCGDDDFVLYLGDAIYGQSMTPYIEDFKNNPCANLNLVKPVDDPRRFGVASVTDGRITKLVEKPENPESNLAMAGLYVFGPAIWSVLPDLTPSGRGEYEITDAIQMLIDRGETVRAYEYDGTWFDTGTLPSFLETSRFLTNGENLLGEATTVDGELGENVVMGRGSWVQAPRIENTVVLPGARIESNEPVVGCLLGGHVVSDGLRDVIRFKNMTK